MESKRISADFMRLDSLPGIGDVIYLGATWRHPEYAEWENEIVTLVEEGELEAEARLIRYPIEGDEQWYGVLVSPIRDIYTETVAS